MDSWDALRAKLENAIDAQDFTNAEHAANAYNALAQALKVERETQLLESSRTEERLRFWVPVLGALFSAVAIFGTFVAGISQHRDDAHQALVAQQRETYARTLQAVQQQGQSTAIGSAMLAGLLTKDETAPNAAEARAIAVVMLTHTEDIPVYQMLLHRLLLTTNDDTFQDIVDLNRDLLETYGHVDDSLKAMAQRPSTSKSGLAQYPSMMPPPSSDDLNILSTELDDTRNIISSWWSNHVIPERADLTYLELDWANLDGVNFGSADLTGTTFDCASVHNADFSNLQPNTETFATATGFNDSSWKHVKWWEAKLSPGLKAYLTKNYPRSKYGSQKQC
jgi:hypothetical protein